MRKKNIFHFLRVSEFFESILNIECVDREKNIPPLCSKLYFPKFWAHSDEKQQIWPRQSWRNVANSPIWVKIEKIVPTPWNFFWEHKITNFTPKKILGCTWHPNAEISAKSIFEICGFWPKIYLFWSLTGLWSPKMGSAPWKMFWWHKIIF